MCGIAGIFDHSAQPLQSELQPMIDIIQHRGPDSDGYIVDGPIAMGMRRLSIIDLSTGDQPITNEDGSLVVICNGEIYNYIELRDQLKKKGHIFKTGSDTEVLVHLFEQHGIDMLPMLNGMFAFAIWDKSKKKLYLARDRMGIKPLYYAQQKNRFSFGSEIKSILIQPNFRSNFDFDALADYLQLGYIPYEASPIQDVRKLLPGHYAIIDAEQCIIRKWWSLEEINDHEPFKDVDQVNDSLIELFDDSVRLRMRSDVPVASFLSGGIDSSLITVTSKQFSEIPINTYTVGFVDTKFDETGYAKEVADQCQTRHHQVQIGPEDLLKLLPRLLWHMDEPIYDATILPQYCISKLAAEQVKVCLSGLGGDELFGGYSRYMAFQPGLIRRTFNKTPALAGAVAPFFGMVKKEWYNELRRAADPSLLWSQYLPLIQIFDTQSLSEMGFPSVGQTENLVKRLWASYPGKDLVGQRQFIDHHTYLPDQILALTDKMSMAVSLETRVPFTDYRLFQFAARLNGQHKHTADNQSKQYLKKTFGKRLPDTLLNRRKFGFSPPVTRWVTRPEMVRLIKQLPEKLSDFISPKFVKKLICDNDAISSNPFQVWSLFVFYVWLQVYNLPHPPEFDTESLFV